MINIANMMKKQEGEMKRLGIFCFYDKEGIVDSYIEYLLGELMTVLDRLIIVVNGQVNEGGKHIFFRYTNELIIRENKGFDAGAYYDVIVHVLGRTILDWDELVLCNDTFFGPFVPMKSIFEKMKRKQVDFWGLNEIDNKMMSHIQSYFLVFGYRILQSGELTQYFQANINPLTDDIAEVLAKFEQGLFLHLIGKQYSYGAYCDTELCYIYESPDICLERFGFPVLKKKAFSKEDNTKVAINAVRYVRQCTNYDIAHILQSVQRLYGLCLSQEVLSEYISASLGDVYRSVSCRFSEAELNACIGNRGFYIYGVGICGRILYYKYAFKNEGLKGFVVSDTERIENPVVCGFPVFHYGEIDKNSLVVLGVGKRLTEILKPGLDKKTSYIELWE